MYAPTLAGEMGFKDLKIVKETLLAKQGWRIMQDKSILLHKIFKARYFPWDNFLESRMWHNPSYVWKGIWGEIEKLPYGCMEGVKWEINSNPE